jgi:cytochrome oxidase Cu insertion factor (SCO1/SenC/PrrC family)
MMAKDQQAGPASLGRVYFRTAAVHETKERKARKMTKLILPLFLVLLLGGIFNLPAAQAQQPQPQISHTFLKVGDVAPDFTLRSDQGTMVKLSDYRGKQNVILAFYVLAFTGG